MKEISMNKIFLLILLSIASTLAATPDVIIGIYKDGAIGDRNQIVGVKNAIKANNPAVEIIEIAGANDTAASSVVQQVKDKDPSKKYLIIGIGDLAFSVFRELSTETLPHIKTLALGHQWSDAYASLMDHVTWIAVPDYAMPDCLPNTTKTRLIPTNGVSHAVTRESLRQAHEANRDQFTLTKDDCIVILGGDAPNKSGKIKRFTKKDAKNLAKAVAKQSYTGNFYILNGPRTGKHDSFLKEIPNIHKNGIVDRVTTTFSETLKQQMQGVNKVEAARIHVFDFQFGQNMNPYLPLLGAALDANACIWVSGESSSMVSEITSVFPPARIIVYSNHAMNTTHRKHIESVYGQGRAQHYRTGSLRPLVRENNAALPDARTQITHIISEEYAQRGVES